MHNVISDEIEAELRRFEQEEAEKLGLRREHYRERVSSQFTASQRPHTTLLVSGLTLAHDQLIAQALRGIGYAVEVLDVPDNTALQLGKEFGSRGQCNPTWYTVGNLVKHLIALRDNGLSTREIIERYVFVTAGACGPCRFGTYVTEYRKALRDSGFDGFRVLLFQQQGGLKQATGDEVGLKIDRTFTFQLAKAALAGDVINLLGYRLRPYEVIAGSTDAAIEESKRLVGEALANRRSVTRALLKARAVMGAVKVDRTVPKPKVSVIGEFWAMTTEGDGNYALQRFLEQEGAEVDIQALTNWGLYVMWENRHDTEDRVDLRGEDGGRKGLSGKDPLKKLAALKAGEYAVRAVFQTYANAIGLHRYHLPDMDQIARHAASLYDVNNRGGEGHMEVGKVIHFVEDKVNHLTISVKPFGCMPSSGVSDGVQSYVTAKWPDALFLPIETTGDSKVNVYSRVQMMLFKAKEKARAEYHDALTERGMDEAAFRAKATRSWKARWSLWHPRHHVAGTAANVVRGV